MAEGIEVVMVAVLVEVGVRIFDLLQESSAQDLLLPVAEAEHMGIVIPMAVTQDIRPVNQLQDFLYVEVLSALSPVEDPNQLEVQVVIILLLLVVSEALLELAVMVRHLTQEVVEADITEAVEVVIQLVAADRHTVMEVYVLIRHIPLLLPLEMEL
jgi:hypothetical protein